MKRGFTILELLVASLLLAMLVTMLSMMFNQSSIAWRTGIAGVAHMDDARKTMGRFHYIEDDILPGIGDSVLQKSSSQDNLSLNYQTVSLLDNYSGEGIIDTVNISDAKHGRAYDSIEWNGAPSFTYQNVLNGAKISVGSGRRRGGKAYVVGVRSMGPDGVWDTDDDITNWPEEVDY